MPYLHIYRSSSEKVPMPRTDSPYLYVVLTGSIRLYTPSGILDYVAGQHSISEIDTPLWGHVLAFPKGQDFLALSLDFTLEQVISVVLKLEENLTEHIVKGQFRGRRLHDRGICSFCI
ncbi:MAG TPA: AraC family transcriptional regulator [Candidatus Blautia faecavium]|uniref:AraC family transcriptional regulator n=1 Tax=Candidatus Blautia faecavium TaxID=2838487 RepID=A0A9D2RWQ6_9FIRM|nr:AraC family transcriptional regulator [Candidatus Blautia faecavium]